MKGLILCLFFLLTLPTFGQIDPTCNCTVPGCCTLTRGYWCNHNAFENEPRNIAWPTGECLENNGTFSEHNSIFPGVTWLEAVCAPAGGDACFIAAPQYIAARLNKCNGACVDDIVNSAISVAEFILDDPGLCPGLTPGTIHQELRAQLLNQSAILDSYNNGFLGPGHCNGEPPDCPEYECEGGCTLTMGYWKNHNVFANRPRNIPWPVGCRNNDTSSHTELNFFVFAVWIRILDTVPRGDMCFIAGRQLITAWLNLCNGACIPEELVPEALENLPPLLEEWCVSLPRLRPPGSNASEEYLQARRDAQMYSEILDAYNNGILLGPGHCETIVENSEKEKGETSKKAEAVFENLTEVQNRRLNAVLILVSITLGIVALGALCLCGGWLMKTETNGRKGYKAM